MLEDLHVTDGGPHDAMAIIEAVSRLSEHTALEIIPQAIVLPKDKRVESLKSIVDQFRVTPERRRGMAILTTVESFAAHVKRFTTPQTVIFADVFKSSPNEPQLIAVYDYHPAGANLSEAGWREHKARYPFPVSDEWKAWRGRENKELDAPTFAAFLEDRIQDILAIDATLEPSTSLGDLAARLNGTFASPSQLLDLSRSLTINAAVNVKQAYTLASGEISVAYTEVHNDGEGRPIKVPGLFVIGIPVFRAGDRYRIACRLRYRLVPGTGKISWWFNLVNPDVYFDDAVKDVARHVEEETQLPVLFGTPEA
jgi:hypothetical protein